MKPLITIIATLLLCTGLSACSKSEKRTDQFDNFKIVTTTTEARSLFAEHSRGGDGYNYDYKIYYKDQRLFENEKNKPDIEFYFLQRKPYVISVLDGNQEWHLIYEKNGELGRVKMKYPFYPIAKGFFESDKYIVVEGSNVIVGNIPNDFDHDHTGFTWFSPNKHIIASIISDKAGEIVYEQMKTIVSLQLLNLITGKVSNIPVNPIKQINITLLSEKHDVGGNEVRYCWLESQFEWVKQGDDYVTLKQKIPPEPFEFSKNSECYQRNAMPKNTN
jgi:hypothetical protein